MSEKGTYASVPQKDKYADTNTELPKANPPKSWGVRHTQTLLLFVSLTAGICIRAHLSVSVVAMTSNTTLLMWHPNISTECLDEFSNIKAPVEMLNETNGKNGSVVSICDTVSDENKWNIHRVYKWNKKTQEMIMFSFFVGYTTMQIPMSMLAQKFGGKVTVMSALGTNGVLSILTPWMPLFSGWLGVCAFRLLQGMTQAAFYPSIHTMLAKWAPLSERGRLGAYIYTGSQFGTVIGFQIAGLFAGSPALGWPATFWFCGAACLLCFLLLALFGAPTPYHHPHISTDELLYIADGSNADKETKNRAVPWRRILSSPPIWGIVVTHVGSAVSYLFVFTQIPLYMNKILGVDIKRNGVYSSLPYLAMYFASILMGYFGDCCINRKIMSIANVRRFGNTIGMGVSGLLLISFCYVESTAAAVVLLILCLSAHSGVHIGWHINMIDLSPNFAGSIMALSNMIGSLFTLVVPVCVSNILGDDVTNHHKWQILFWIFGGAQFVSNLVYVAFARGSPQSWNFIDDPNIYLKDKDTSNTQKATTK